MDILRILFFRRDLSVTVSLEPFSINRGVGQPFEVVEHLGDLVSLCESAWEPSNSLVASADHIC